MPANEKNKPTPLDMADVVRDVEKVSAGSDLVGLEGAAEFSLLLFLGGESLRCGRLAEEAYQSLKILRRRGQEELLPYELQSPQTQAAHSDLILQFGKQRFHFLSLPLRMAITLIELAKSMSVLEIYRQLGSSELSQGSFVVFLKFQRILQSLCENPTGRVATPRPLP